MDTQYYLDKFQNIIDGLDAKPFSKGGLKLKAGYWAESAVLKIQKPDWLNQSATAKPFCESVFFSIWISDECVKQNKLSYNIHALKMRELTGYRIKSRDFAEAFRLKFKRFENQWPNVSTNYGPLTLMEGWLPIDLNNFEKEATYLANSFLSIYPIIDDLLADRKK